MEPIIQIENLTFKYPEEPEDIIKGVSCEIEKGSFVCVVGRNGSGKSTLAKLLNGIYQPDSGRILVGGKDTSDEAQLLSIRRTIGLVFQNPDNQIVNNVVEDDVAFAPENLGVEPSEIRERVNEALKLTGMYDLRLHAPHLLSGGQKQRVAIAGVLAMRPEVIVLDEPTAMLDPGGRSDVIATITDLCRKNGITVILITHHMEECIHADRLIIMAKGKIVEDGTPLEVFSNVERMTELGLDVPETVLISKALNDAGAEVPTALDIEACTDAIVSAYFGKK